MKGLKICLIMLAVIAMTGVAMAGTLQDVRAKGFIQAGVNGDLFGFGKADDKGVWRGLDVDTARAISAAVFGDADKERLYNIFNDYLKTEILKNPNIITPENVFGVLGEEQKNIVNPGLF